MVSRRAPQLASPRRSRGAAVRIYDFEVLGAPPAPTEVPFADAPVSTFVDAAQAASIFVCGRTARLPDVASHTSWAEVTRRPRELWIVAGNFRANFAGDALQT